MKMENKFNNRIGMLYISIVAIVALIFSLLLSNTHLAKGTYSATCTPGTTGTCTGELGSQQCLRYIQNGYTCSPAPTNHTCTCNYSCTYGATGTCTGELGSQQCSRYTQNGYTCDSGVTTHTCTCNNCTYGVTTTCTGTLRSQQCLRYINAGYSCDGKEDDTSHTCTCNKCNSGKTVTCTGELGSQQCLRYTQNGYTCDSGVTTHTCTCNNCAAGNTTTCNGTLGSQQCQKLINNGYTCDAELNSCSCNVSDSKKYTITFLNANGDGKEFNKSCQTNSNGKLDSACISAISSVCGQWSPNKWDGGSPQSGGIAASSFSSMTFTANKTYYCVAGTSIHAGGNSTTTPSSASNSTSKTSSSTIDTRSCYACDVDGSKMYVYATSDSNAASNTGGNNCAIVDDKYCNVPVNPKTGTVAIIIAWVVGIIAIGYSFWYFKKMNSIKNQ